jgi:ABC-type Na+ efflux pump permease subunit
MLRRLERNPISWLHQYSWSARLTKWGWCLLIVGIETILSLNYDPWRMLTWQYWLANVVFLGMSFAAVGSFRKERQTGALELLLVTPLTEVQVIWGRVWGLWLQFLPTMAVLLVVALPGWGTSGRFGTGPQDDFMGDLAFLASLAARYATIPVLGLYFSMCRLHYIVAGVLTFTIATCVPWLLVILLQQVYHLSFIPPLAGFWSGLLITLQLSIGLAALYTLNRNLKMRNFTFT